MKFRVKNAKTSCRVDPWDPPPPDPPPTAPSIVNHTSRRREIFSRAANRGPTGRRPAAGNSDKARFAASTAQCSECIRISASAATSPAPHNLAAKRKKISFNPKKNSKKNFKQKRNFRSYVHGPFQQTVQNVHSALHQIHVRFGRIRITAVGYRIDEHIPKFVLRAQQIWLNELDLKTSRHVKNLRSFDKLDRDPYVRTEFGEEWEDQPWDFQQEAKLCRQSNFCPLM